MRRLALVMIIANVAFCGWSFYQERWDRVFFDFTDALLWCLVWTLEKQIDELEKQNRPTGA
jgi:hypothetical protein